MQRYWSNPHSLPAVQVYVLFGVVAYCSDKTHYILPSSFPLAGAVVVLPHVIVMVTGTELVLVV